MSEMVERVAKAFAEMETGLPRSTKKWEDIGELGRVAFRLKARAAIEAMRNPGEDFSGYLHLTHDLRPQDWGELIDAALE